VPRWTSPNRKPTVIKKYGNRRLYDTETSQYITQEELAAKVKQGAEVRVIDAKTNEDLTQVTLTQIILESRGAAHLLPVPLLLQLVRMDDHALAEFFGRYVSWALEIYTRAKQGAEALVPYNPFATAPFSAMNTIARWFANEPTNAYGAPPSAYGPPPAYPPPPAAVEGDRDVERPEDDRAVEHEDEVSSLRREVEALKRQMKRARR
jgi:polyhydroxyalkanoate synthesis repressor PhaR